MLSGLRLYLHYTAVSIRSQMQYRTSFLTQTAAQLLVTGVEFLAIWALFARFGSIGSWSLPEVAILYGMANVAFSLADAAARGFDTFADMVKSGDFDWLLLRPRSTALQVAGREFVMRRAGRFLQGLVVLLWGAAASGVDWTCARAALALMAILGGACLFYGILVLQATLAFWTTETLEIVNTITYGGVETAEYPLEIYRSWFRNFFTYVIPLACVNYLPALAILGRAGPPGTRNLTGWVSPIFGLVFLLVSLGVWTVGVRHYRSTGS